MHFDCPSSKKQGKKERQREREGHTEIERGRGDRAAIFTDPIKF